MTAIDSLRIQGASDDMVTNTGEVFYPSAPDEDDRVFLQVMSFTGDIGSNFHLISQPHTSHFTQSGVRLFGRCGVNSGADTSSLGALAEGRCGGFLSDNLPAFSD